MNTSGNPAGFGKPESLIRAWAAGDPSVSNGTRVERVCSLQAKNSERCYNGVRTMGKRRRKEQSEGFM